MPLSEHGGQLGARAVNAASSSSAPSFLIFYSNRDSSGKLWCPDCRDVEEIVKKTFSATDGPNGVIIWVGQRDEWKSPQNVYRGPSWRVSSIPTIIRQVNGEETGRLVEGEILDSAKLKAFLAGQ